MLKDIRSSGLGRFEAFGSVVNFEYERIRKWRVEGTLGGSVYLATARANDLQYLLAEQVREVAKVLADEDVKTPYGPAKLDRCVRCSCSMLSFPGVTSVCADCKEKLDEI